MTYEELSAEVQKRLLHPAQDITNETTWEHKAKLGFILLEVVKLHKPGRITIDTKEVVCDGCDAGDNYYSNMWPCPTIKTIEMELL